MENELKKNNLELPDAINEILLNPDLSKCSKWYNNKDHINAFVNLIPYLGGFLASEIKTYFDYRDSEFIRKFVTFISELDHNGLDDKERIKFLKDIGKEADDSSGNIMASIIDRLDNINKQKILANLVIAKGTGDITIEDFFRLSFILERIPYVDLKNLSLYQTEYYDENGGTELLYSTGALRTSMLNQSGDKYVLSPLGVKLLKFGVKCDGIKIPEIQGTQTIASGDVLDKDDIDEILKEKKTEESREEYEKSGQAMFDYDAYRGK